MTTSRRSLFRRSLFLASAAAATLALAGCAMTPTTPPDPTPPIIFLHGNGDSAAVWQTQAWRFESNGWPRERLHALNLRYPLAREDDAKEQPGRTSIAEYTAALKAEIERVRRANRVEKVVLIGSSRGGYPIRDYVQNDPQALERVSHAVLAGTPNHGVWNIPGRNDGSEFAGQGAFLTALNKPKNSKGDEVVGPVKWQTLRSDSNDKFAQPDGLWIGSPGVATNITAAGPELKGATNVVLPKVDHREVAFSPAAFDAMFRFVTGRAPQTTAVVPETGSATIRLEGKVTGLGREPAVPDSGDYSNNIALSGGRLNVWAVNPSTGERTTQAPAYTTAIGNQGDWGPFNATPNQPYEFEILAPGYAMTHVYRSGFVRGSRMLHFKGERIAAADKDAPSVVTLIRPRGYFDTRRDTMSFDGQSPPAGVAPTTLGAGTASSKIKPTGAPRAVVAEFNGERIVGRAWPAAQNHVSVIELTY